MEHKLSTKFCQYLVHNRIITNEYYDVYVYGMELLLSFLLSTILIMFMGLLTDKLIPTIEYLIIFIMLRNFFKNHLGFASTVSDLKHSLMLHLKY